MNKKTKAASLGLAAALSLTAITVAPASAGTIAGSSSSSSSICNSNSSLTKWLRNILFPGNNSGNGNGNGNDDNSNSNKDGEVQSFIATNGLSSQYREYSSHVDQTKETGTIIWLHGDGAYEWKNPDSPAYIGGKQGILATAKEKNMSLIVPKTPGSRSETWWENGQKNAQWIAELYNERTSGTSRNELYLTGFSGGAEEISYFVLTQQLKNMNADSGQAVMFGGGGSPQYEGIVRSLPKNSVINGDFPLTWVVGEHDDGSNSSDGFDALTATRQAHDFYKSQGWDTKRVVVAGKGHLIADNNGDLGMYGRYLSDFIN